MAQTSEVTRSLELEVVTVINPRNFGEQSQVIGVAEAMKKIEPSITTKQISCDDKDGLKEACQGQKDIVVVTSGIDGAKAINGLVAQTSSNVTYVHTNHMV